MFSEQLLQKCLRRATRLALAAIRTVTKQTYDLSAAALQKHAIAVGVVDRGIDAR